MKPKKRQKLCYNCEGDVDLDVIVCPLCAADLREEKPEQQRVSFSPSVHSVKQLSGETKTATPLEAMRQRASAIAEPETSLPEQAEDLIMPPEEETQPETKSTIVATALFTLGIQLLLLSFFLLFFQSRGMVILKWDARIWFLYLFAAAPLLILGYRSLK